VDAGEWPPRPRVERFLDRFALAGGDQLIQLPERRGWDTDLAGVPLAARTERECEPRMQAEAHRHLRRADIRRLRAQRELRTVGNA
jgi:hypothetical protein